MKKRKILKVERGVPYRDLSVKQAKEFLREGIECPCNGDEGVVKLVFKAKF